MANFFVYLAVIVSGSSVLAVELLGTRLVAPSFGASLYVWSALISVTLAALSLGYLIGGRWADKNPTPGRLCLVIAIAGAWIAIIPWLRMPVLAASEIMDMRLAVLFCAVVLFFLPLALLGMVSPYAIRMKVSRVEVVGRTAGNLYAISTIASVVAALLTGFVLIPNVGVVWLSVFIGVLLLATAIVGFSVDRRAGRAIATAVVLIAVGVSGFLGTPATEEDAKVLADVQSTYAEIRVVDLDGTRHMMIDGTWHTAMDLATWAPQFPYVNVLDMAKEFVPAGNMLLVGLGGGAVVKSFAKDGWHIDAVEIDPVVVRLAKEYFLLADSEATIYTMDGRQYMNTVDKTYDAIIMDAFGSSSIPFHLVTDEAFALVHSRLSAGGVFEMNIQCIGWNSPLVRALTATAERHFKHVIALPIAEPPDQLGNLVLLMSDKDPVLLRDLPKPPDRFSPEYDRSHAWENRFVADTTHAPVLTDDKNPVDIWSEEVNIQLRKQMHVFLKNRDVAW